jgi:hypothetical protein
VKKVALIIICQDDIGGLEVRGVDNEWVPATPVKGSVLVSGVKGNIFFSSFFCVLKLIPGNNTTI